jgi:hypothetical protein
MLIRNMLSAEGSFWVGYCLLVAAERPHLRWQDFNYILAWLPHVSHTLHGESSTLSSRRTESVCVPRHILGLCSSHFPAQLHEDPEMVMMCLLWNQSKALCWTSAGLNEACYGPCFLVLHDQSSLTLTPTLPTLQTTPPPHIPLLLYFGMSDIVSGSPGRLVSPIVLQQLPGCRMST